MATIDGLDFFSDVDDQFAAVNAALNAIDASQIVSGVLNKTRLPSDTLYAASSLDASKLVPGVDGYTAPKSALPNDILYHANVFGVNEAYNIIQPALIQGLDATQITTGVFKVSQIPQLDASLVTTGTLDLGRMPANYGIIAGSNVYGLLTNASITGSNVYGLLTNASISGSNVNGLLTNASISGSNVYGMLTNASINGVSVLGQLDKASIDFSKLSGSNRFTLNEQYVSIETVTSNWSSNQIGYIAGYNTETHQISSNFVPIPYAVDVYSSIGVFGSNIVSRIIDDALPYWLRPTKTLQSVDFKYSSNWTSNVNTPYYSADGVYNASSFWFSSNWLTTCNVTSNFSYQLDHVQVPFTSLTGSISNGQFGSEVVLHNLTADNFTLNGQAYVNNFEASSFTVASNLYVGSNLYVSSNVYSSNVYASNVFIEQDMSVGRIFVKGVTVSSTQQLRGSSLVTTSNNAQNSIAGILEITGVSGSVFPSNFREFQAGQSDGTNLTEAEGDPGYGYAGPWGNNTYWVSDSEYAFTSATTHSFNPAAYFKSVSRYHTNQNYEGGLANYSYGWNAGNPVYPSSGFTYSLKTAADVWSGGKLLLSSDRRIKTNIMPISSNVCLLAVRALEPSIYRLVKEKKVALGFIAQEVREIIPEAVSLGEGELPTGETVKDFHTLDYNTLTTITVGALKALYNELAELKKRVLILENGHA